MILPFISDATLSIHDGVKAEEKFEMSGTVPDLPLESLRIKSRAFIEAGTTGLGGQMTKEEDKSLNKRSELFLHAFAFQFVRCFIWYLLFNMRDEFLLSNYLLKSLLITFLVHIHLK
ncbi:unnamed protein product [Malus baccata var. baccata]